ncbi:MAG: RagB/SusD family nutrient uptake outer membrane protein [Zunongwangia sp.]|mgnify:FL=1|uniref:RagB/SusD family nutrient uptake outer membrane protein n=1 Tax=Zunongwangia profunda TaxID=398743 RepID=UPI000C92E350|nr:RagB/SusD family nutrient uptake outer membrane protein [Zunongwangia profunda]MAO37625.1 RagB/SusD family nutrient uptake outer membrane protein [Zunongwangia sp.]|tara:strand:+ start:2857 stop:4704 length:1848 start_codon:yes stop_codon:yes gene_type:complete
MKNITYTIILIICVLSFSCTDYLDKAPEDQLTLEKVFNDKTRTEDWLAGIYSSVPDPYFAMLKDIGYDALGDDMAPSTGWEQFGWNVIAKQTGNWSPSSSWDSNYWDILPKRIRSAFIFIENVRPLPSQKVTEEDVENMRNEARFLVAYYYWLLIEAYGPVPFTDKIVTADEDLLKERRPFDEIVAWIDNELKEVSNELPDSYSDGSKFGRATSVMALAVRARMLLFAASPLVNGNKDYDGFVNSLGEPLFNTTYDPQKWVKAAEACKELIDVAHTAGHDLYYEYNEDGSIDPFLSYQNMMFRKTTDGNKEILFARPDNNHWEYDKHAQPRGTGGNGGLGITQSLVDAFFMENGLPIDDPNSGYKEKGFSEEAEYRNTNWIEVQGNQEGKEGQVTLPDTYNMYTHREPRFYISVLYNRAWYRRENRTTRFMLGESDGGPTHDAPQNGYLVRKKVHPDHDPRAGINPYRPGILYRLGEAYLNYAEALNESDPGNPQILEYVNLIRERAGIPDLPAGMTQAQMKEAIRRERRVELNCESGIRYRDIRRWKIGEETLDRDFYGMNFFGTEYCDEENNPDCFFQRTVYQTRRFSKKNYWVPIHQTEIDINPDLVQNPFW